MNFSTLKIDRDEDVIALIGESRRQEIEHEVSEKHKKAGGRAVNGVYDVAFESTHFGRAVAVVVLHFGFKDPKENGWSMCIFFGRDAVSAAKNWHINFQAALSASLVPQSNN